MSKLTKGQKRFHDLILKCLHPQGVPAHIPTEPDEASLTFIRNIDTYCKAVSEAHGVELHDDHDDPVD